MKKKHSREAEYPLGPVTINRNVQFGELDTPISEPAANSRKQRNHTIAVSKQKPRKFFLFGNHFPDILDILFLHLSSCLFYLFSLTIVFQSYETRAINCHQ